MRILFLVGVYPETRTVFSLAEGMYAHDKRVVFLFFKDGCRCLDDPELTKSLSFAESMYFLKDRCSDSSIVKRVEPVDYDGWVRLLEDCDRVVSWT